MSTFLTSFPSVFFCVLILAFYLFCIIFFRTFAVAFEDVTASVGGGSAKAKQACLCVHLAPHLQCQ